MIQFNFFDEDSFEIVLAKFGEINFPKIIQYSLEKDSNRAHTSIIFVRILFALCTIIYVPTLQCGTM